MDCLPPGTLEQKVQGKTELLSREKEKKKEKKRNEPREG